eukprot:TRINITY_DN13946_c0_g1_i2.p1 TRINITY_DN13946_c0_g1~~TRINITY_DN13946_c0_g1_i2.p1  ORF type:complete len:671 (+),score=166.47 TRINITY_DN13946_c0_g1_i2:55-2067(+)
MNQNEGGFARPDETGYVEPYWSSKPTEKYSLEVLKDGAILETIDITSKPFFLLGRMQDLCDIAVENPSVSRKHCVLQHKDTGEVFLYDLGSTHGTFLNKHLLAPFTYAQFKIGDMFRLGQSTRMYILNGPEELTENLEGDATIGTLSKKSSEGQSKRLSKKQIFDRRVEQIKKLAAEREKQKIQFKHTSEEEGISWGFDEDAEEVSESESSDYDIGSKLDLEKIKGKDLTDKQKGIVAKIEGFQKKIENLKTESGNLRKKGYEEMSDGQRNRVLNIDNKVEELQIKVEEQEDNLRTSLKGEGGKKDHSAFYRKLEEVDSEEDEYFDRAKFNTFNKRRKQVDVPNAPAETYESLKFKLETLISQRQKFMEEMENIGSKKAKREDEEDALDAFMKSNEVNLTQEKAKKLASQISEISNEIEKCNAMLSMATPSYFKMQKQGPYDPQQKSEKKAEEKEKQMESSSELVIKKVPKKKGKVMNSMSAAIQRIEKLKEEKEKQEKDKSEESSQKTQNIPEKKYGLVLPSEFGEKDVEQEEQVIRVNENVPIDELKLMGKNFDDEDDEEKHNYFKEIVKNANRDEIKLEDYQQIKGMYDSYRERDKKIKEMAPLSKTAGLQHFSSQAVGEKRHFLEGSQVNINKKAKRVYGVASKPLPRNMEEEIEEEEPEDLCSFQ